MKSNNSYKLCNHLGNVLTVVSDRKIAVDGNNDNIVDYFLPDVVSSTDYYPFGSPMPGRNYQSSAPYKYGYQGSEKDDEISGSGNSITTHFRELDTRLGRWWSPDPKEDEMPWQSPYVSMDNNPILLNDPDGDCPWCVTALVGALIEGGAELGSQLLSGKSLDEVDWADVGLSATQGAIDGSGAGLLFRGATSEIIDVAKSSVDYSKKEGFSTLGYNSKGGKGKTGGEILMDYAGNKAANYIGGKTKITKSSDASIDASKKVLTQTEKKANKVSATSGQKANYQNAIKYNQKTYINKTANKAVVKTAVQTPVNIVVDQAKNLVKPKTNTPLSRTCSP